MFEKSVMEGVIAPECLWLSSSSAPERFRSFLYKFDSTVSALGNRFRQDIDANERQVLEVRIGEFGAPGGQTSHTSMMYKRVLSLKKLQARQSAPPAFYNTTWNKGMLGCKASRLVRLTCPSREKDYITVMCVKGDEIMNYRVKVSGDVMQTVDPDTNKVVGIFTSWKELFEALQCKYAFARKFVVEKVRTRHGGRTASCAR